MRERDREKERERERERESLHISIIASIILLQRVYVRTLTQ